MSGFRRIPVIACSCGSKRWTDVEFELDDDGVYQGVVLQAYCSECGTEIGSLEPAEVS